MSPFPLYITKNHILALNSLLIVGMEVIVLNKSKK